MAGIVSLQPSFVIKLSSKLHQTNLLQNVWILPAAVRSVLSSCQHVQALCAGGFLFLAVALSTSPDRWSECEWKWTRSLAKDWFLKLNQLLFLSSELELELLLKRLLLTSSSRGCCGNTGKSSLVLFCSLSPPNNFKCLPCEKTFFFFNINHQQVAIWYQL